MTLLTFVQYGGNASGVNVTKIGKGREARGGKSVKTKTQRSEKNINRGRQDLGSVIATEISTYSQHDRNTRSPTPCGKLATLLQAPHTPPSQKEPKRAQNGASAKVPKAGLICSRAWLALLV